MSHELRTPLNAIIGFSDLINEELTSEEVYSFASTINKSGNHLLELVEDIFDITLIETGGVKIHKTEFKLHNVLEDIRKILKTEQSRMLDSNAEIILKLPVENDDLTIYTDRQKFNQIFMNLLKNALKFTPSGFIEFGYTKETENKKSKLKFYVKDSGIGIPEDMHEIIFDMFRQVDESYTRAHGGVGIGLSLTKKLTGLLGGEIWLKSTENKGTTFYFTLVDYEAPDNIVHKSHSDTVELLKFPDKTILVVEDDESSYVLLEVLLKALDVNFLWAKNGVEAVEVATNNPDVNLILMDVNMPVMNGYEASTIIKKTNPNLPIIAQTAYAIAGDKEKALAAGCDDYIVKPIKRQNLYKLLAKYLISDIEKK
jgi:CheY-like chemotaxis protein